ncbi:hypothetical protein RJ639_013571 [Escallonia herrerae]|uniref:Glycosyltransferase n=1 Tax=Escallonia herrerae TaxID=1293975 RepID=A0AA88VGM1_9ASTE|nr:hypothetical protein RJ639_013571 [Escallonia herrerae]
MNHILLPRVNFDDLSDDVRMETRGALLISRSLPSIRDVFKSLVVSTRLVVDHFATDAFVVAREFKVSPYIFFPSTAMTLSLFLRLPKLDQTVSCEYRDLPEPIQLPGCIPIHGKDLLDPVQDRNNDAYKWLLHLTKRYTMAEGIMVNSFKDLEGGAIESLQQEELGIPPVYPIGPLIQMQSHSLADGSGCLRWLDGQPRGSVLFISFGSVGVLSYDQLNELALGLEMSEQRFLWVVRRPIEEVVGASNAHSHKDPFDFLPEGFLDRTKGCGLVVSSWAPQAQILSHDSTGGFLTHCGWNSTLESVVNGIPLIAWPLYAEQRMNASLLTEDLRVALRPKANDSGLVGRADIAAAVRTLMDGGGGKLLRDRMRDLKDAAAKVIRTDGSSTKALTELACKWKSFLKLCSLGNTLN